MQHGLQNSSLQSHAKDFALGWGATSLTASACSAQHSQMLFFLSLPPSFVIFLNTQQLAGRKPAEWGLIVVLELHVSFVTVTANLPGAQRWEREREGELSLISWICLRAQLEAVPCCHYRERWRGWRAACASFTCRFLVVNAILLTKNVISVRLIQLDFSCSVFSSGLWKAWFCFATAQTQGS